MDSWTPAQMEIMKLGGNQKCQTHLKDKGNISQNVPIKQKYESDVAQLYKLILKARAEGKIDDDDDDMLCVCVCVVSWMIWKFSTIYI